MSRFPSSRLSKCPRSSSTSSLRVPRFLSRSLRLVEVSAVLSVASLQQQTVEQLVAVPEENEEKEENDDNDEKCRKMRINEEKLRNIAKSLKTSEVLSSHAKSFTISSVCSSCCCCTCVTHHDVFHDFVSECAFVPKKINNQFFGVTVFRRKVETHILPTKMSEKKNR